MIFAIKVSLLGKGNNGYFCNLPPSPLNRGDTWLSVNPHLPKMYICKCTRVSAFQDDEANLP